MSVEPRLTFSLIESICRKGKDGSARAYRAVMKRDKPLGTDEVIMECVKDAGLEEKKVGQVRRNFEMVLDSMISHTLQDGRTRRIGDYFSLRLDITGSFDRPDARFDPAKHSLTLNFVTPKCLRRMTRKEWPVNEWRKPIGKIDKVYSAPDGEIGKLKFGADIVIEGHDLKLKDGDGVHLFVTYKHDPFGVDKGPTTHQFGCDVKENTDTRLVVEFPKSRVLTPDVAIGQPGQIARFEFSTETKKGKRHHGRRADVVFVA